MLPTPKAGRDTRSGRACGSPSSEPEEDSPPSAAAVDVGSCATAAAAVDVAAADDADAAGVGCLLVPAEISTSARVGSAAAADLAAAEAGASLIAPGRYQLYEVDGQSTGMCDGAR